MIGEYFKKPTPIKGYKDYAIYDDGRIYSFKWNITTGKLLKQSKCKGYRRVGLSNNNKLKNLFVHQLVARTFIDNPNGKEFVNHKDGNKCNNDVSNLEWVTREENWKHNVEVLGYSAKGKANNHHGYKRAKLYPNEELRNKLVELGVPRYKHNLAELGEKLPRGYKDTRQKGGWIAYALFGGKDFISKTEANARAKMLIYLIENKLLAPPID